MADDEHENEIVDEASVIIVESDNAVKEEKPEKKEEVVLDEKDKKIKDLQTQVEKVTKQANYAAGSYRLVEKLQREVAALIKNKGEKTTETKTKTNEELAELFNTDIVAGVNEVVNRTLKAEKEKEKKEKELEDIQKENVRQIGILEKNQQKVLEKYPELSDDTSEYTKIWLGILDTNPSYKTNYLGPLLTMRDMEVEARKRGLKIKEEGIDAERVIEKEVSRRDKARQTNLKAGHKTKTGGEVILTQDQVSFCKHNNIPLKTYAATLKRLSSGDKKVEV